MQDKKLVEKFIDKNVSVTRTVADPVYGKLSEVGEDGIIVTIQRQEIGDMGIASGRMIDKPMFIPWDAVQGIS